VAYSLHASRHLLNPLELPRSLSDSHAPQESKIELGIDPTVVVSTGGRDAPLCFKAPKVRRGYAQPAGRLRYMIDVFHRARSIAALL
jgi:hypothetical protein